MLKLPVGNLNLTTGLRVIRGGNLVLNVIFCKHCFQILVAKVLPPITDQDFRGSKPSENIFL